jgi:hypothetical protein
MTSFFGVAGRHGQQRPTDQLWRGPGLSGGHVGAPLKHDACLADLPEQSPADERAERRCQSRKARFHHSRTGSRTDDERSDIYILDEPTVPYPAAAACAGASLYPEDGLLAERGTAGDGWRWRPSGWFSSPQFHPGSGLGLVSPHPPTSSRRQCFGAGLAGAGPGAGATVVLWALFGPGASSRPPPLLQALGRWATRRLAVRGRLRRKKGDPLPRPTHRRQTLVSRRHLKQFPSGTANRALLLQPEAGVDDSLQWSRIACCWSHCLAFRALGSEWVGSNRLSLPARPLLCPGRVPVPVCVRGVVLVGWPAPSSSHPW